MTEISGTIPNTYQGTKERVRRLVPSQLTRDSYDKPRLAKKFYAIVASAMILGLALDYAGFNAVKMLFWSAVLNGVLAPPLIVLVVLLISSKTVMGKRVNPPVLKWLGWATAVIMAVAAVAMFATM